MPVLSALLSDHRSVFFSLAGPDVNQALVLEEKLATEAATAPKPSCPEFPSPANVHTHEYVNHSFEECAPGASAASSAQK